MWDSVLHYCVAQSEIFKSYSFRNSSLKSQWVKQLLTKQYHVAFQVLVSAMWRLGFCSDVMAALHQPGDLCMRKAQWWPVSWMFRFGLYWDDASSTLAWRHFWGSTRCWWSFVCYGTCTILLFSRSTEELQTVFQKADWTAPSETQCRVEWLPQILRRRLYPTCE